MKKRFLYPLAVLLLGLSFGACGSDDSPAATVSQGCTSTAVSSAPSWSVNWEGTTPRPDWQEPSSANYENWTVMLVQIEDALKPYASSRDLLALFVGSELRGLASPAVGVDNVGIDNYSTFVLKAYGNESDQNVVSVTLSYYNATLRQTFSRSVTMKYDMDKVYGIDSDLVPEFVLGNTKYPVAKKLDVASLKSQIASVATPAVGDVVAFFSGSECRGTYTLGDALFDTSATMYLLALTTGEPLTMKYYSRAAGRVYSFTSPVIITR